MLSTKYLAWHTVDAQEYIYSSNTPGLGEFRLYLYELSGKTLKKQLLASKYIYAKISANSFVRVWNFLGVFKQDFLS